MEKTTVNVHYTKSVDIEKSYFPVSDRFGIFKKSEVHSSSDGKVSHYDVIGMIDASHYSILMKPSFISPDREEEVLASGRLFFYMDKEQKEIYKKEGFHTYLKKYEKDLFPTIDVDYRFNICTLPERLKKVIDPRLDISGKLSNEDVLSKFSSGIITQDDFVFVDFDFEKVVDVHNKPLAFVLPSSFCVLFDKKYFDIKGLEKHLKTVDGFSNVQVMGNYSDILFEYFPTQKKMNELYDIVSMVGMNRYDPESFLLALIMSDDVGMKEFLTDSGRSFMSVDGDSSSLRPK